MKQMAAGNLVIGGGWPSRLDPESERAHVRRESVEGNLWVADRVLPALRSLHVIRTWAAMNVLSDGAPILGEVPGVPGFFTASTVNGLTLAPVLGRINADLLRTGRTGRDLAPFTLDRFNCPATRRVGWWRSGGDAGPFHAGGSKAPLPWNFP